MTEYLKSILNAFQDLVFIFTEKGVINDYLSPNTDNELILPREVFLGKHYTEVLPPEVTSKIDSSFAALNKGKQSSQFDYSLNIEGEKYWYAAVISKIELDNGTHYLGVVRNITERKNQELFIRGILDSSLSGIITFRAIRNDEGKIIDFEISQINDSALKMIGFPKEQMQNTRLMNDFDSKRRNKILKKFTQVTDTGNKEELTFEYTSSDGETIWFQSGVSKYKDGVVATFQDITEQINREKKLRESEKKYRNIFENVRDVFYQTDVKGVVTEISPSIERYSGYKPEEIIGKPVVNFYYYPEDRASLMETLLQKNEVIDFEVRLKTKSGQLAYASVNAYLVMGESGEIVGVEGHMRDISERKKAEEELVAINEQLKDLNRQKNKLFSVIAHDLRNSVSGASGLFEIIFDDYDSCTKEELFEYLTIFRKSSENSIKLLNDLLFWAKNQFEEISVERVQIDLFETTESVLNFLETQASEKEITLENKIHEDIQVYADVTMIKTILRNLVSNAIKFSNPEGKVVLSATSDKKHVQVSVKDNGIGISEENLQKIFDRKQYFTSQGTQGEKGTGLGLDLCLDLVNKQDGKMWAESEPDKGTEFIFTLPHKNESSGNS